MFHFAQDVIQEVSHTLPLEPKRHSTGPKSLKLYLLLIFLSHLKTSIFALITLAFKGANLTMTLYYAAIILFVTL